MFWRFAGERKRGLIIATTTHNATRRTNIPSSFRIFESCSGEMSDELSVDQKSVVTHDSCLGKSLSAYSQPHDGFFTAARPLKHSGQSSFVHHGHPLANSKNFFHIAADHHDRYTAFGQPTHQLVAFRFRADVDPAGWF